MQGDNLVFLENLEWFDESGKELVHRLPEKAPERSNGARNSLSVKVRPASFFTKARLSKRSAPAVIL